MERFRKHLTALKESSQYRQCRISEGIDFSHNDYLGLSQSTEIREAGIKYLKLFGAGSGGSRLLGGHLQIFEEAEEAIAEFFNAPSALFFSSGYLANLGVITAMAPYFKTIYSDEKNHASIIDALRLVGKKTIYPHNKLNFKTTCEELIVTESLFSMDGDFVDSAALKEHLGFVILDQAHAAGVFFEDGRGLKVDWSHAAVTVTFGKAFGVSGAAVLCTEEVREVLINSARSFIFSTAPSPVIPAMVIESLKVVQKESWRREALWELGREVRGHLQCVTDSLFIKPMDPWDSCSMIIPIPVPGADRALRLSQSMRDLGFEVRAIRYPTVPLGSERIRLSLNLNVSKDNTLAMAKELVRLWKEFL